MDFMIYKHDQFSLLDMIEVESAQFENWFTGNREIETETKQYSLVGDKLNSTSKGVNSSLLDDLVRLESLHGNVLNSSGHNMESDWLEREECMNWEPHLLVNPRTGAPINVGESDMTSSQSLRENAFTVVPMSDSNIHRQTIKSEQDTKTAANQPVQTFTTFTLADSQPQLMSSQPNTVQVYLQVTNAVGNIIPSDGTLCLIKMESEEDSSLKTTQDGDSCLVHSGEDSDDTGEGNETYEKPVFSYSCLIAMALKNSENGSLPVNEIYAYILEKFPYFRTAPDGWKNSIRHNLSLNKCFEKIENPTINGSSRKGCLWGLNPAKADKMDDEIAKWIKRAAKSNMSITSGCADGNLIVSSGAASTNGDIYSSMQPSTPTLLTVCSKSQNSLLPYSVAVVSASGELNMLEDSLSADPMLTGVTAQSSFWDDETDELMSSAISFGARRVTQKGTRVQIVPEKESRQSPLVTCRSYHVKTTSGLPNDHSNVLTSPVAILANQAAIG